MMPIEALRLLVVGIHDKRVNGNLGPGRAVYGVPQQGASELKSTISDRDSKASQSATGTDG